MDNKPVYPALYYYASTVIERFKKTGKPYAFNENTNLAKYIESLDAYKAALDDEIAAEEAYETAKTNASNAAKNLTKIRRSFRNQVGDTIGEESDEFEWAGGTKPSERIQKAKETKEQKQKLLNQTPPKLLPPQS